MRRVAVDGGLAPGGRHAVVVFDGVAGVEPQSETNWRYAEEAEVPRICYINKLDRTGASFEKSYASILDRLSQKAVRLQLPIGAEGGPGGWFSWLVGPNEKGVNLSFAFIRLYVLANFS